MASTKKRGGQGDEMDLEGFLRATGLPRTYALGLVKEGILDDAVIPDRDTVRVRSVGLPMIFLADEIASLMAHRTLTPAAAAHVLRQILPQMEALWRDALAGSIARVEMTRPDASLHFLQRAYAQYHAMSTGQMRAKGYLPPMSLSH